MTNDTTTAGDAQPELSALDQACIAGLQAMLDEHRPRAFDASVIWAMADEDKRNRDRREYGAAVLAWLEAEACNYGSGQPWEGDIARRLEVWTQRLRSDLKSA